MVLWGALLKAQSNELVGTFSVTSATGSDPSPTVVGTFNSTVGFLPQNVDTGDILLVRQVFAGNHRRKLYRITGIAPGTLSPLTLNVTLIGGTSGGPFPAGTMSVFRPTPKGALLDSPNTSQEIESYAYNYNVQHFEDADVDTTINRSDSMFVVLNDGTEFYVGPSTANGISDSYQIGDSIFVVTGTDTIFTGIAYANPEIDTIYNDGTNYYMVTVEGDTIEIGAVAQVVANGVHPTNPPSYLIHIDTLGADTIYFDNNGTWSRFNTGGTQIGAPMFSTNNNFATFTPAGVPPIGAFIVDSDKGGISRKTSVAGYTAVTGSNGRNVKNADRYQESGDMDTWNIGLNAAAFLSITNPRALVKNPPDIAAPTGLGGQTFQGNIRTLVLANSTGSPVYVRFESKWRGVDGFQLDSFLVTELSTVTLDFSWDVHDSEEIMRLTSTEPYSGGVTYTFLNQVNGIDLINSGGTVTAAPNITELTYAAVVGADSILIWDSSANAHRRASIAEIVALASSTPVTVTDQANGLDIILTGQDITISHDFAELSTTTPASNDMVLVYDVSLAGYRTATAAQIASLGTPAPDATKVTKGGDTDGVALRIGTNDAQALEFETGGVRRGRINSSGTWLFDQAHLDDIDVMTPDSIYSLNPRFFSGIAQEYQTYTTSGVLNRKGVHYVDGAADVTMTTDPALPDRTVFCVKNQDIVYKVTVAAGSGNTMSGSGVIPSNSTAWFQKRGTVIERLGDIGAEYTYAATISTTTSGTYTLTHPFGAATIKFWDVNQINAGETTTWTAIGYGNGFISLQQWKDQLPYQTTNIATVFIVKI